MMIHKKIQCLHCPHYRECSRKTRTFINYCGSHSRFVAAQMQQAEHQCRKQGGFVMKKQLSHAVQHSLR